MIISAEAERILQHKEHDLSGHELQVSRVPPHDPETKNNTNCNTTSPRAVLVQGIKPSVGRNVVELFFENTKRSGGGEIEQIEINQKSGRALIHFAEEAGKHTFYSDCTC